MSIACKVRDLAERNGWYARSALYRISPTLEVGGRDVAYVVVAYTPRASDHGKAETTVFLADGRGRCDAFGGLDGGAEQLSAQRRVIGRCDHKLALHRLGAYRIVSAGEWARLESPAKRRAEAYFTKTVAASGVRHVRHLVRQTWGAFVAA